MANLYMIVYLAAVLEYLAVEMLWSYPPSLEEGQLVQCVGAGAPGKLIT